MAHETVKYPSWDGLSDNPQRTSLNDDIAPNSQDWDQVVKEVLQHQTTLSALVTTVGQIVLLPSTANLTANTTYHLTVNNGVLAWTEVL